MREAFVEFGFSEWGKGTIDPKMLRSAKPESQRFMLVSEFARLHRVWKPSMDRMIADGTIVTKVITAGKVRRILVDLELTQPPSASAGTVTVREAADYLGIPVSVLHGLRAAGVYKTKTRTGRESTWHQDDVDIFLARGLALADQPESVTTEDSVPLQAVMRLKLRSAEAKTDILAALFDGRLPVTGRHGDKLSGLMVSKSHLDEFILDKRRIVEDNTHSLPEVSEKTGLDLMVISSAIEQGLLSAIDRDGRHRVPAESVLSFNANYLLLKHLALSLEANTRSLTNLARRIGIPLIELVRPAGGVQPVLRKESEEALVRAWHDELREHQGKVSRNEQLAENHTAYETSLRCYLDRLLSTGGKLPRRAGLPNKAAIAKACGFKRDVLYNVQTVVTMLEAFDLQERSEPQGRCLTPYQKVVAYLESMTAKAQALPRNANGRLNILAISKSSGVHRNVLYSQPELMTLLEG